MWLGNDAERDYFTRIRCGHNANLSSCTHSGHISADDDRDQAAAYFLPADHLDLSGFDHRICRFDHSHPATGFNHAQGASHWSVSLLFRRQKIGDLTPFVKLLYSLFLYCFIHLMIPRIWPFFTVIFTCHQEVAMSRLLGLKRARPVDATSCATLINLRAVFNFLAQKSVPQDDLGNATVLSLGLRAFPKPQTLKRKVITSPSATT